MAEFGHALLRSTTRHPQVGYAQHVDRHDVGLDAQAFAVAHRQKNPTEGNACRRP
jgi:hypothetical protein